MEHMPGMGIIITLTIVGGLVLYIGIPMLIIALIVIAFYFVGTPFYNVLDILKKSISKIREKAYNRKMNGVFKSFLDDEYAEHQNTIRDKE